MPAKDDKELATPEQLRKEARSRLIRWLAVTIVDDAMSDAEARRSATTGKWIEAPPAQPADKADPS